MVSGSMNGSVISGPVSGSGCEWIYGRICGWICGWICEWTYEWTYEWTCEWIRWWTCE